MTSNSTLGAGLNRLINGLMALSLLLLVAAGASAQRTIFVDSNGGDDGNNGQSPTIGAGVNGPVRTIDRAVQLAAQDGSGNVISIEAGDYEAEIDISNAEFGLAANSTNLNNLTFRARPDQQGDTLVELMVDDPGVTNDVFRTEVPGFTFASESGATFSFTGGGNSSLDFESGSVALGNSIVSIDDIQVVEQTNATVTGTVAYGAVPNFIRFNGDNSVTQSTLLPSSLDIASGVLQIQIALGSRAATVNDNARTFTLGGQGRLTLGDDGGQIFVEVRDGNTIAGLIEVVDGNGGNNTGRVTIDGYQDANGDDAGGSIGDLLVNGGEVDLLLEESDDDNQRAGEANTIASITVRSGELVLSDQGQSPIRYKVSGDFIQSGGNVRVVNADDVILAVDGNFRRTANTIGNFDALNLYLEGTAAAEFAPGTNLTLNSLHINRTPDPATGSTARKMVTFLQDITVNSGATGTNGSGNIIPFIVTGDATVDLNGNLVNVTNGGESIVDGTVSDSDNSGAVRFNNGGIASGTGVYSSILVSGPSIDTDDNFTFTGALILLQGGIDINGGVSPVGPNAAVIVNIEASNDPRITGNFNSLNNLYNLVYQDSEGNGQASNNNDRFQAGREFNFDNIRDLEVDITNATVNVPGGFMGGTIKGDVIVRDGTEAGTAGSTATLQFNGNSAVVVDGSTTVEDDAVIELDNTDTSYTVSTADNVLDGVISGDGQLRLRGGSTITGTQTTATGTSGATTESRIDTDIRLNNGATASLLQIRTINGDITDAAGAAADGGTLTLGLVADNADVSGQMFTKDRSGNVNGEVTLDFSTLVLASDVQFTLDNSTIFLSTLNTNGFTFFTESVGGGDNDDGPDELVLKNDVIGTGAVWPSSDLTIRKTGTAPQTLTIPVFHPGDDNDDDITVASNINVTTTLRITGNLDAESTDVGGSSPIDYAVTLSGAGGATTNLILGDGYGIQFDGNNEPENGDDREIVITGPVNLTTNERGQVNPYTDRTVLATQNVQAFTVNNDAQLTSGNRDYTVASFVTSASTGGGDPRGQLDLNSNDLSVTGDVTLGSDGALFNTAAGNQNRLAGNGDINGNYSQLSLIGANASSLMVTPNGNTGTTTFGDGVDLRIAKDATTTEVTLMGGSLVFDDDFPSAGGFDDETLVLERGTFVAGDSADPNGIYIRLDHTNRLTGSATSDAGQGFVFVPSNTQFPTAYIEGNVRKRIFSDPSLFAGDVTPGRVVYPVGSSDGTGEGYAEFVLDFESIAQSQSFGLREVTVNFVAETPTGSLNLPITRANGTSVDEPGNFYWLVSSTPSLGAGTFFNVEARYDGFELESATNDGTPTTIDELTLIRRQFGNEMTNPYRLVSENYDSFLLQDPNGDEDPVVIATGAEAFLGPQGTIFTYGLTGGNRATANGADVPTEFALNGNLPNPFSSRTAISFDLPEAAEVSVEVYDVMGRRVMTVDKGAMNAGADQRVEINGSGLASGVYVYRVNVAGASETWVRSGQITLTR